MNRFCNFSDCRISAGETQCTVTFELRLIEKLVHRGLVRKYFRQPRIRQHILRQIGIQRRLDIDQRALTLVWISDGPDDERCLANPQFLVPREQRKRWSYLTKVGGDVSSSGGTP